MISYLEETRNPLTTLVRDMWLTHMMHWAESRQPMLNKANSIIAVSHVSLSFTTGNRRFRFIVAFNLDRRREAPNRRAKSLIVESIVDQIRAAGGRFLEKIDRDQDFWIQISERCAREKVSHALRDKYPLSTLTDAKSRLKRRLADPNRKTSDYHFIVANERLLRADLPDNVYATDEAVECILTTEIESIGVSVSTVSDSLFVEEQPQVPISSLPRALTREVNPHPVVSQYSNGKRDGLVYASCSDEIFGRRYSSLDCKTNDMFWNLNTSFDSALVPHNVVLGEDIDDEDNEHGDFVDWNDDGDLPHDFTADDCENLVAMLDFASSLP